jgi:plastocyanin
MVRRTFAIVAALAAVGAMVVATGASGRATKTVDVGDNFFAPKNLKIKKGDKLAFDWVGVEEHDVAKAKGPGKFFESGPITGSGVQYKRKFKDKGKYKIICTLHQEMKMNLEVKK